jgi:hypothetical protein
MKKSITTFLILAVFTTGYGQQTTETIQEITKADYLKKSKNQKRAAWILAGVGTLSVILGTIEVNPEYGENSNSSFFLAGGLVAIGASVPLFIASARNKKKGMSLSFKNNTVPRLCNNNLNYISIPSISLKIGL